MRKSTTSGYGWHVTSITLDPITAVSCTRGYAAGQTLGWEL
ncbi:MAG: hypothetical protein ABSG43_05670 [Solirubrobacteraceae bacterium]|jgi:hypothetical protein